MIANPRLNAAHVGRSTQRLAQSGNVLFLALIGLVIMTLAGLALIRSVDTTNMIAGNFAFKQAALQAADAGVEAAFAALTGTTGYAVNAGTDAIPPYYSTYLGSDTNGLPMAAGGTTSFVWSSSTASSVASPPAGYSIMYVIDRLCLSGTTSANIAVNCLAGVAPGGGSAAVDAPAFISANMQEYYRITVRVTGPHNTVSYVQTIVTP